MEFLDARDADEAVRHLDGRSFGGREISVCLSQEKRKTPREMAQREDSMCAWGRGEKLAHHTHTHVPPTQHIDHRVVALVHARGTGDVTRVHAQGIGDDTLAPDQGTGTGTAVIAGTADDVVIAAIPAAHAVQNVVHLAAVVHHHSAVVVHRHAAVAHQTKHVAPPLNVGAVGAAVPPLPSDLHPLQARVAVLPLPLSSRRLGVQQGSGGFAFVSNA